MYNVQRFFSKFGSRDPYDVLGLKKSCTTKDVKKAYIKLCKELHPDIKPGDNSQHKKFIELNDAYTAILNSERTKINIKSYHQSDAFSESKMNSKFWESEKPWHERKEYKEQFHQHHDIDINNLKQMKGNSWILAGCFTLVLVGSALYIFAYRYATSYKSRTIDERSKKISESYYDTRKIAKRKSTSQVEITAYHL